MHVIFIIPSDSAFDGVPERPSWSPPLAASAVPPWDPKFLNFHSDFEIKNILLNEGICAWMIVKISLVETLFNETLTLAVVTKKA
jgi:hypothetical protein